MKKSGIFLAATVGALFTTAALAGDMSNSAQSGQMAAGGSVKCMGVNSCKGKGACKSSSNSCKGNNDCKSKGVKMMKSEDACTKQGGTVVSDS